MSHIRKYCVALLVVVCAGVTWWIWPHPAASVTKSPLPLIQGTSRQELDETERLARARLSSDKGDVTAAIRLADVLLRKARVEADAARAIEAEHVLEAALEEQPSDYQALRLLGAVYLSQHRFSEAAEVAKRTIAMNDRDAWNYGVLGDAAVELGEYDAAFDAFDRMVRLRPDAASYARVAYAHELQGRLDEALRHMRMAAESTGAHDPESLAWHYVQLGNILFHLGRIGDASREYSRAQHVFPGHPYARAGLARVAAAHGDYSRALGMYRELLEDTPSPELAATVGDLLARTGAEAAADKMYVEAEALEREGWKSEEPQPAALARMLSERGRNVTEAVRLAEEASRTRRDIYTMDALAWSYFNAGRIRDAHAASVQARRTGTADRRIVCHAQTIAAALIGPEAKPGRASCPFEMWTN